MPRVSKDQLVKLQKTLKTDAAIGKKFGISRQAIHQLRVKYGVKANLAKNKERNEKIAALYKSGKPGVVIAKIVDLSVPQVYRVIKKQLKRK